MALILFSALSSASSSFLRMNNASCAAFLYSMNLAGVLVIGPSICDCRTLHQEDLLLIQGVCHCGSFSTTNADANPAPAQP
jgi:hypothetical protein